MKRLENWQSLMFTALTAAQAKPFAWGAHDCCRAATAVIHAMTGHDLMTGLRRYRSLPGAVKMIRTAGHDTLKDLIVHQCRQAGWRYQRISLASQGDLILMQDKNEDGKMFEFVPGICCGTAAVFATDQGWLRLPLTDPRIKHSIRIG